MKRSFAHTLRLGAILLMVAPESYAAPSEVLARWRGGELTRSVFTERYDPDGQAWRKNNRQFRTAVCKAAYFEIYVSRAHELGLDRDSEVLAEHQAWRTRVLARRYQDRNGPGREIADAEIRAFYDAKKDQLFTSSGQADLEILFVRCGDGTDACRERMTALRRRIEAGEELAAVIAEEKARSGEGNGVFEAVPLGRLSDELRTATLATPLGRLSPVIETPIGLFSLRVSRRNEPRPLPFEQVEKRVRKLVMGENAERWRRAEVERLRRETTLVDPDQAGEDADDALFAAAALAAGLDREPDFLAREAEARRWKLADHAFYLDGRIVPSNADFDRQLAADPERAARHRRYSLLVALVPAGNDPYAAVATAREIDGELQRVDDAASFLRRLPAERPQVRVIELTERRARELRRRHRLLVKSALELEGGAWRGPIRLDDVQAGDDGLESGVAFALLEGERLPPAAEIRHELVRAFRSYIGSIDVFPEVYGRLLDFELLPGGVDSVPLAPLQGDVPFAPLDLPFAPVLEGDVGSGDDAGGESIEPGDDTDPEN